MIPDKVQREEKYEYPPDAIRETIVNALAHRDYESVSKVQVRVFDNRIEIWSPGKLPDDITIDGLKREHRSVPRNPLLFKQLFLVKYVEDVGGGTLDMIKQCRDWGDFEHLIREVFEKEFSVNGGEVKVTQASRDGGVDAVAFDPDPIRGGKTVIQAKRYTNTVGVGAVRDLYGTVMNEGANKGILVTTSDYGPDSYEFISGKPLVLLNGANLLHMLEKHGHKARIDIQEARKLGMNQ